MAWIQLATPAVEIGVWADPPEGSNIENVYIPVVVIALSDEGEAIPLVLDDESNMLVPAHRHHYFLQAFKWRFEGIVYKSDWDRCHEPDPEDEDAPPLDTPTSTMLC